MANLFNIPENVMIQHVFLSLDHNDLLRLRRVCKQTKAFADAYLWTPQQGHQGKWELKIDSRQKEQTLQAFLELDLPPPSRLYIVNKAERKVSTEKRRLFFDDEHLEEFMGRYSKYVTHLRIDKLFIPFTSRKEIGFYESLVNLKELHCCEMVTVGGADLFREKTRNAEGSFLIRPTFKKLKSLELNKRDCVESMYHFINGVFNNLEELKHPIPTRPGKNSMDCFVLVRQLIEHRGLQSKTKLFYDWSSVMDWTFTCVRTHRLQFLRLFASCHNNGVLIKNLDARFLDCFYKIETDGLDSIVNRFIPEWMPISQLLQRNLFVGNFIHSLLGVSNIAFLIEMPGLETIKCINRNSWKHDLRVHRRLGDVYPQWPNLKKMDVKLDDCSTTLHNFLWGQGKRHKLEELCLNGSSWTYDTEQVPCPRMLRSSCGNLKKLTLIESPGKDDFFVGLWEGFPLLEDVTLSGCENLTNKGFIGNGDGGSGPVFVELKKLKHRTLGLLADAQKITNAAFLDVFRHLGLSTFKLYSNGTTASISMIGIKGLLTGRFAETIEKLDLKELNLENVSKEELQDVVSCFRCTKML